MPPMLRLSRLPKPFDGVRVNVAAHIDALRVVDPSVLVTRPRERVVRVQFIGVNRGRRQRSLGELRAIWRRL